MLVLKTRATPLHKGASRIQWPSYMRGKKVRTVPPRAPSGPSSQPVRRRRGAPRVCNTTWMWEGTPFPEGTWLALWPNPKGPPCGGYGSDLGRPPHWYGHYGSRLGPCRMGKVILLFAGPDNGSVAPSRHRAHTAWCFPHIHAQASARGMHSRRGVQWSKGDTTHKHA